MRTNILILTPQEELPLCSSITDSLRSEATFSVTVARRISPEIMSVDNVPQVAIVLWSDDLNQTQHVLRSLDARTSLLIVCDSTAAITSVNGAANPATDFLFTPFDKNELLFRVRRLIEKGHRHATVQEAAQACALAQLIGEDPKFVSLKRRIPVVARFDSTVLLTGETGTGKERFARALHYSSPRAAKPFLPVNCGAIPLDLFESELYGHRRGAFTGSIDGQTGLIAEAEGGTLFLDEVETLSLASQVKLLRFLQDQVYYPVGSAKPKQANVWILASTNIELPLKIQDGTFREDLYYRLAVIGLALPPLRQRPGDISLLASHFWKIYSARAGRQGELPPNVLAALSRHNWPGNVRELQNVVQQLAVSESELLQPRDLTIPHAEHLADSEPTSFAQRKASVIADFEKRYLTELLRTHQGNVTHAALEAGKDRRALGRLIKKHRIARQESS